MTRHLRIIEFALMSLWRRKFKNLSIGVLYVLMVFMVSSVVFFSESFKKEALLLLKDCPELIVQRTKAGRHALVPEDYIKTIQKMPGVGKVIPRVWGYYYDPLTEANYTVLGTGGLMKDTLVQLEGRLPERDNEVAVGYGVAYLRFLELGSEIVLQTETGQPETFKVVGIFKRASQLLTNELILMTDRAVREFFGIPEGLSTDIYVEVYNPQEVQTIAKKIKKLLPQSRPITRQEVKSTYESVFSWRSGLLLAVLLGALMGFFLLAWDRA
ncbi:MAG: ABC transporter permease, partial [Nitrospirae bacterium]